MEKDYTSDGKELLGAIDALVKDESKNVATRTVVKRIVDCVVRMAMVPGGFFSYN